MGTWDTVVGAVEGAGTGAMIGSEICPGYGTLIGGVIGAVAGGVMGYETGEIKDEGVKKTQANQDEQLKQQDIMNRKGIQQSVVASMKDPSHSAQTMFTKSALKSEQAGGYSTARIENMHFTAVDNKTSSRVAVAPTYGAPVTKL